MDDIVQHQLGRAAASGSARFAPYLPRAPILHRIRDSLEKVYAGKGLAFTLDCPSELNWRIDEGDAFEVLGNVMDNAAKWARHRIVVSVWREADRLNIRVEGRRPRVQRYAIHIAAACARGRTGARSWRRPGGGQ